ncbi:phosphotransferase family protein [Pinirhizobacter sp.]|uniref:phosphotransferase family protein n=1 Tax=Pinirhizobacter sp. TaxID=2950432 RepID=UPI002F417314
MTAATDQARPVREEDQLDVAALDAFFRQHIDGLTGTPTLEQFPGGASNLTYLLGWGNRQVVLRTAPKGAKAASAHDMLREARVMAAVGKRYPYVPAILAVCEDDAIIGRPFFAMEPIRGVILRKDMPDTLGLDAERTRALCHGFIDRLVDLHAIDASHADIASLGRGEGYVQRQLSGWAQRWRQALTEGTDPSEDIIAWLQANRTTDVASCVIHNDFRFDNVVLDPADPLRIIGVLDWELATVGDPLMDLGSSLAYWVQTDDDATFQAFRLQPSNAPGMLTRAEVVAYYAERTGRRIENFRFYEVFGLFRLMVIIQQIYRRFALGQTTNPRFKGFGQAAAYMGQRCRKLMEQGH